MLNRVGRAQKEDCCLFFFSCVDYMCQGACKQKGNCGRGWRLQNPQNRKIDRGKGSRESSVGGDTETDDSDRYM